VNPEYSDAFLKQGKCYEKEKDFKSALEMFQKAV
jgi:hypothetical protein